MTSWKTLGCALVAVLVVSVRPAIAHVMPLTDRQIAAGSPHVVVAVVEEVRTRWNEQHTLLFTDYSLHVEDRLRGKAPERITVSIPGGTLDGQTHGTCVSTPLEPGSRYLLFLQDLDRRLLVPITGGWQGVVREVRGPQGRRLAARGTGKASGEFSRLVRSMRGLIERIEKAPRPMDTAWMQEVENPGLPAKVYDPTLRPIPAGMAPALSANNEEEATAQRPRFYVEHPAAAPLVFDPMPADSPFSRADQEMMAYWNLYLRKPLFLVARDPSPGWAYNNGVSEIAGFPSNETMLEQFGVGWFEGTVSAVLYIYGPDGRTVEADIALNPARRWIVGDGEPAQTEDGAFSFKPIVLGHLGTAWGYLGPYPPDHLPDNLAERTVDSVMNFLSPFTFAALLGVDAEAVRATFGGRSIVDGLISPYSIFVSGDGYLTWAYARPAEESAQAGTSIRFSTPIKIENPGTAKLKRPLVEVYLVPHRNSLKGAILLKRLKLGRSLPTGASRLVDLGRAALPARTPAGDYSFAFVLRVGGDAYPVNNRAWSHPSIRLTVTR